MSRGPGDGRRTSSQARVLENLRLASRRGDRTALALALDEMRTLAYTPRYWLRYLSLVQHPLARLVDLLVIKQGDKIARQKGWTVPAKTRKRPPKAGRPRPAASAASARSTGPPRSRRPGAAEQPPLFPGLS